MSEPEDAEQHGDIVNAVLILFLIGFVAIVLVAFSGPN
jgi:hypothetical protein